ncbi:hypothetical protein [Brucella sp. 2716]|uniref:hypothetical protein n=1 Tax=Brucella sp. 2716 TaxID=2975052 RepID=UPI0038F6968B
MLAVADRWYRVRVNGRVGYLHHNWVKVDQFVNGAFENRYVQIASFDNYPEIEGADLTYSVSGGKGKQVRELIISNAP